jgi:hypothetical protein
MTRSIPRGPATFDGYANDAIASGELQTVLDDW